MHSSVVGINGVDHIDERADGDVGDDSNINKLLEAGGECGLLRKSINLDHDDVVVTVVMSGFKQFAEGLTRVVSSRSNGANVPAPITCVTVGEPFEDRATLVPCA